MEAIRPGHRSNARMVWDDWLDPRGRERAIEEAFDYVARSVEEAAGDEHDRHRWKPL